MVGVVKFGIAAARQPGARAAPDRPSGGASASAGMAIVGCGALAMRPFTEARCIPAAARRRRRSGRRRSSPARPSRRRRAPRIRSTTRNDQIVAATTASAYPAAFRWQGARQMPRDRSYATAASPSGCAHSRRPRTRIGRRELYRVRCPPDVEPVPRSRRYQRGYYDRADLAAGLECPPTAYSAGTDLRPWRGAGR